MGIEYVDGRRYAQAVIAGAEWVRATRDLLNRINVFPVADGDTGTNMALSLSATAAAVRGLGERHLGRVSESVAEASVLGAKGNSGLILAHWFLGFRRAVGGDPRVDAHGLAVAMRSATRSVYDALEKPVEGTILTVMRAGSDGAHAAVSRGGNVLELLDDVIVAAEDALARTPELLATLAKAGVVDAGAAGWVHFMKGVRRAIRGEPPPEYSREDLPQAVAHPEDFDADEITERFCTELICRGKGFEAKRLRRLFAPDGTYLLVATSGSVFKLHIHTNHPDAVFRKAAKLGTIEERKVDDMLQQRTERRDPHARAPELGSQPGTVAIVCDSTADLPADVRAEHDIGLVPLQVLFGDQVYRDQVDLDSHEFYRRVAGGETPATSQPPPRAFVEALERIRPDRDVIVVTLDSQLSGTYRSALSGAELASHPRVEVVDSRSATLGLGLIAKCAARLAARGAGTDEILSWIERWRNGTGIVFTVATLEYLRRGGRIGAAAQLVGNLLGLRPILTCESGRVRAFAKARGDRDAFEKMMSAISARAPAGARVRIGLVDADRPDQVEKAERYLRETYDVVELVRGQVTGVVGAHTGPGTWGVAWQIVPESDPLL